jgi:hypothetical protein
MNRRVFIGILAGGLLAAPVAVEAQESAKVSVTKGGIAEDPGESLDLG